MIYLDNAATTKIDPKVIDEMLPWLYEKYGNASSIYSLGREAKLEIEKCRKKVANILNVEPGEIFFTSSGTESTNTALTGAIKDLGCTKIITSNIEHSATEKSVRNLEYNLKVKVEYIPINENGFYNINELENILTNDDSKTIVSILHIHNELGNIYPIKDISTICQKHGAFLHIDGVQSVGHFPLDLTDLNINFLSSSAHKFHGPKGIGFLYVNKKSTISPMIFGGNQERNMRAGTESPALIVGLTKALELAYQNLNEEKVHIQRIKSYCIKKLKEHFSEIYFNGDWEKGSYKILNVGFKKTLKSSMLVINLDTKGICVASGSACSSGTNVESSIIGKLEKDNNQSHIRISFSKYNSMDDIDCLVTALKECLKE